MLAQYQQITQLLLRDAKMERYNLFDLTTYINIARGQVAGEGECARVLAILATAANQQSYPFSSIPVANSPGIAAALAVRMITGNGALLTPRPWEWFNVYYAAAPTVGLPQYWCQYAQGLLGTLLLAPTPDVAIDLYVDTVCLPLPLTTDSSPEAIPYPWTDAVPYYAAYMALLTEQQTDAAEKMLALYQLFLRRARAQSTPTVLPGQYQGGDGARLAANQTPITPPLPPAQ